MLGWVVPFWLLLFGVDPKRAMPLLLYEEVFGDWFLPEASFTSLLLPLVDCWVFSSCRACASSWVAWAATDLSWPDGSAGARAARITTSILATVAWGSP